VIKEGDTLTKIAQANGLTLDELLAANQDTITNPNRISVGDEIVIPVPGTDGVDGGTASASPAPSP
jgi:LysM repeat protein